MDIKINFPTKDENVIVSDVVTFETDFGDENTITVWTGDGGSEQYEGIGAGVTEATIDT